MSPSDDERGDEPLPLSRIHEGWKGKLLPDSFNALQRGIEAERTRFSGCRHLALVLRREIDYDGLIEFLELPEGFADETEATAYPDHWYDRTLPEVIAKANADSHSLYNWRHDASRDGERFETLAHPPRRDPSVVRCLNLRSFQCTADTGFDKRYFQCETLAFAHPEIIGPDLFDYLPLEDEWTSYFLSKGEE